MAFRIIIPLAVQLLMVAVVQPCSYFGGMINCSRIRETASPARKFNNESWTLQCPPWFAPDDDTGRCMAGPSLDGLIEQDLSLLQTCVMPCNCVTEEDGVLTVGFCLHECAELQYTPLPCDARELQNWSCPYLLNKRGVLCSQCIEGYAIPVYSYTLGRVECEHYRYNWLKYLVAAYTPLTFLYIVVAIFTINFASPTLSGAIMFFQIAGNPTVVQMTSNHWIFPPFVTMLIQGAFSFASFWNLDFSESIIRFVSIQRHQQN